jgi:hypothetical protein
MGHADWIRSEWPKSPKVAMWVRKAHYEIHRPRTSGPIVASLTWDDLQAMAPPDCDGKRGREGERAYLRRVPDSLIDNCHTFAGATALAPHLYEWLRSSPNLDGLVPPGLELAASADPGAPTGKTASAMFEGLLGVASAFSRGAQRVHRQRHWGGPDGRSLSVDDFGTSSSESMTFGVRSQDAYMVVLGVDVLVTRAQGLVVAGAPALDLRREAASEARALADIAEAIADRLSEDGPLTPAHEQEVRLRSLHAARLDAAA